MDFKDMYVSFMKIKKNMKFLGKAYLNKEMVRNVLQCRPKQKRGPKAIHIEQKWETLDP